MARSSSVSNQAESQDTASPKAGKESRPSRRRLTLELNDDAYELLTQLASETDKNMADVLRTGLALYGISQDAKKEGRSLAVAEGDNVVKEIVIP